MSPFREAVSVANTLVEALVEGVTKYPRWFRPAVLLSRVILFAVVTLFYIPCSLVTRIWRGNPRDVIRRIDGHARRIWEEQSPAASIDHLFGLLDTIRSGSSMNVDLAPYGTIHRYWARAELSTLTYTFCASAQDWERALLVADYVLADLQQVGASPSWLQSKGECLVKLGRNAEAREFLLEARDPDRPNPRIEELLDSTRSSLS
jgi:hypothetical protein